MFTLQNLNVVRIVEDKQTKDKLISEGYIELKEIKINKKLKGKD